MTNQPKIHFSKKYTLWCDNGHSAKQIMDYLIVAGKPGNVPSCPICGAKLNEGIIN